MSLSHIDIKEKMIIILGIYNTTKALFEHKDNHSFACHVNNTVYCVNNTVCCLSETIFYTISVLK